MASGSNGSTVNSLTAPPENYAFNNLIQDFADEIQEDNVDAIKRRFEGIIPHSVQTGRQIVDYLRNNGYISETNIIYLQQIIRILGRRILLQRAINYAECNRGRRVLHFYESRTKMRPGFHVIRIHVKGQGPLNYEELDKLRHEISRIVLVPPEDVCFAGIEETHSYFITFLLPDLYCEALDMLLLNTRKHYHFLSMQKLGVDRIEVLGNWYKICENCEASEKKRNGTELLPPGSSSSEDEMKEEETTEVLKSKRIKNVTSTGAKKRFNKAGMSGKRHNVSKKTQPIADDQSTSLQSTRPRTRSSHSILA